MISTGRSKRRAQTSQSPLRKEKVDFNDFAAQTTLRISRLTSPKSRMYMELQTIDGFGNHSPHWTIPSSRRDPPAPDYIPAPGEYNVTISNHKIPHVIPMPTPEIKKREENNPSEDLFDVRKFPETKSINIGKKTKLDSFIPGSEAPGPSYVPPPFGRKNVSIGSRRRDLSTENSSPGPARYTPSDPAAKSPPRYTVPHSKVKCFIEDYYNENPGPGAYDVRPQLIPAPRWTAQKLYKSQKFQRKLEERDRPWAVNEQKSSRTHFKSDNFY